MKFRHYLALCIFGLLNRTTATGHKFVFAHFIVGNAASLTQQQWETEIMLAKHSLIDGFALNIALQDPNTDRILTTAYAAAAKIGRFSLFLSFDYLSGGPWPVDRVIDTINRYKELDAQFYYNKRPLVSTFEGVDNIQDWPTIRNKTNCFAIPDWTSLGPQRFSEVRHLVDGFFSWDAWPVGTQDKTSYSDHVWRNATHGGGPYMMPVSPWFYTNLPQWNKNWLWKGAHLWTYRWEEVYRLQPEFVQIISWNDYGESHYIGPVHTDGIPMGATRYVEHNSHDAWRELLPYFIASYKLGDRSRIKIARDTLVYWYRPNPNRSGTDGGTTGNCPQQGQQAMNPGLLAEDKIYIAVLVKAPSLVGAQIGVENGVTEMYAEKVGLNTFEVPFDGQTGNTTFFVMRNGTEVLYTTGPAITNDCVDGMVNWNAVVGSS